MGFGSKDWLLVHLEVGMVEVSASNEVYDVSKASVITLLYISSNLF